MTVEELRQGFANVFALASGIAAAKMIVAGGTPAGANAVRESPPYATVNDIVVGQDIGQQERYETAPGVGDTARQVKRQHRRAVFSVQVYGTGAGTTMNTAKFRMVDGDVQDLADSAGIAVVDWTDTRDISFLLEVSREERVVSEFTVDYEESEVQDVGTATWGGTIENVEATGDLDGIDVVVEAP